MDEDIKYALQAVRSDHKARKALKIRKRQSQSTEQLALDHLETMAELLGDELAEHLPRNHPFFLPALCLVILRKVARQAPEEPEEKSPLEMWPKGY